MIRIRFDGPPEHEAGRFIEVETEEGASINFGEWIQEGDDWLLLLPEFDELLEALVDIAYGNASIPDEVLASGKEAVTSFMWTYSQERAREAIAKARSD